MNFSYRRKIKILPGIYLNLSKTGVSTTIGPKGANLNVGKKGVYLNTGIPGTGIYNRRKVLNENDKKQNVENVELHHLKKIEDSNMNDYSSEIVTSKGLKGIEECLEIAKKESEILTLEIEKVNSKLSELESKLYKKQNRFILKYFTKKETIESLKSEISKVTNYIIELKNQFVDCKADINIYFDKEIEEQYNKVIKSFDELTNSCKIWDITSEFENNEVKSSANTIVQRKEVKFNKFYLEFIKSKFPAFHFQNANGRQILMYPGFILLMGIDREITLIDFKDFKIIFKKQRFVEEIESIPSDASIIDYSWVKQNKDGTRDLRYKDNYQIPIVNYGSLHFSSVSGLNETFYISNVKYAENFANEFMSYLSFIKNGSADSNVNVLPHITTEYFDIVKEFADSFLDFVEKINKNSKFSDYVCKLPIFKEANFANTDEFIHILFVLDLMNCFYITADLSKTRSKEAFALIYLFAKKNGLSIETYADKDTLYEEKLFKTFENSFLNFSTDYYKNLDNDSTFGLSPILRGFNELWQQEYLTNLYRFASIIVKADGSVSKDEEESLKKIMVDLDKNKESKHYNKIDLEETTKISYLTNEKTLEEVLKELNSLVGLKAVKNEIISLINFIKIQKERKFKGLNSTSVSFHMVFTGNPGTGKTTVARIVAEIYKNLGVLQKGQLIETDRSGLVAEYVGQTAIKVNKIVDLALNGILFVDEAYSLDGNSDNDFGKEAVATLIKKMEDNRDKLVVILAGYTNEMEEFIQTNPGLKSRFNRYITFEDFSPEELLEIFCLQCKKLDYVVSHESKNKLIQLFSNAYLKKDKSFGNGRYVRNVFEKSMENQANRIASIPSLTKEILVTLTEEDIPNFNK